jgi:hypothetical protein
MPFRVISVEEAALADPRRCAPPLRADDAHDGGVGAAHGRVIPLVGNTRPYLLDVTVVGTPDRIYADRLTDVLCAVIGDEYTALVDQIDATDITERILPPPRPALGDLLPTAIALEATPPVVADPATPDPAERHRVMNLLYDLARLRCAHARNIRIELQRTINEAAIADGSWDELTAAEQEELSVSATVEGVFPIGIPTTVPYTTTDDSGNLITGAVIQPEWRAATRLVLNTGDYAPWTRAPWIRAVREVTEPDGRVIEYDTLENTVELVIDTEEEYVQSLVAAGVLTLRERPAHQVDPMFADMDSSPIVNPHLRVAGIDA